MSIPDILVIPGVLLILFAVAMRWSNLLPAKAAFLFLAVGLLSCSILAMISLTRFVLGGSLGLALIVGSVPLLFTIFYVMKALTVPAIHDVATRYNPPIEFEFANVERVASDNPLNRPANERAQNDNYALRSRSFSQSMDRLKSAIRSYADNQGWTLLGEEANALEYAATTPLFRFTDDIRIELKEEGGNTVVDARSVSRVGKSDLGANAARIRKLFRSLGEGL